jgi:hypothetical protein
MLRTSGAIPLLPYMPSWCGQRQFHIQFLFKNKIKNIAKKYLPVILCDFCTITTVGMCHIETQKAGEM